MPSRVFSECRLLKGALVGVLSCAAIGATASIAQASPLNETFTISVYQQTGGANDENAPANQANITNPLLSGTAIGTGTYTGDLNFNPASDTIGSFFASGGGALTGTLGSLTNTTLSTGNFETTTVFRITGNEGGSIISGSISHDDGISLYEGVTDPFTLVAGSAAPTTDIPTPYSGLTGAWTLIYVEANGLPAVLDFDVTNRIGNGPSPTPLPAAIWLMGSVMAGAAGVGRWRRKRVAKTATA